MIIGVPRSGTSWVSEILAAGPGVTFVNEPDYPDNYPSGGLAIPQYGLYPVVAPGERAPAYETMWDVPFAGGFPDSSLTRAVGRLLVRLPGGVVRPISRTAAVATRRLRSEPTCVLAKTVHAQFAIEWIAERYDATVVVVRRNLLSVVGSWLQLGFEPYATATPFELSEHPVIQRNFLQPRSIEVPAKDADALERIAWHVGLLSLGLDDATQRHQDWVVVDHEDLCEDPIERFRDLFSAIGLDWTVAADRKLRQLDRHGVGTRTERIARDRIDSWKRSLTGAQVDEATRILAVFGARIANRETS